MATRNTFGTNLSLIAGEDLSAKQYRFAKLSGDNKVKVCDAATDVPVGVIQNRPESGEVAEIAWFGKVPVVVGEVAIIAGAQVGTDANGKAVAIDPDGVDDYYYVGQAVTGGDPGEVIEVLMNCATPVIQARS